MSPTAWPSILTKSDIELTLDDMSPIINIGEAKTHLSDLVARAEAGEEIVLARAGKPVVRLTPIPVRVRRFGTMPGHLPDSFFDPLPEEELAAWE